MDNSIKALGIQEGINDWLKFQQEFLKDEKKKGLVSNYLWSEYTIEEKLDKLREYLLEKMGK